MESLNEKLRRAAMNGRLKDLKRWIQQGADLEYRDSDGITPLLWAANNGHLEIVHYLVTVGCDKETIDTKVIIDITSSVSYYYLF
ncbi:putative ankyrin repeat protein RF_p14 [Mytilus galloprovincialis]|uniref:putative ankyrin repeat protein RF_p14 n=1 Tax=Mytilus galloprovincialis TaxID=29158 RepID=UPI003F7CC7EE